MECMELRITGAYKSQNTGKITAYSWVDEDTGRKGVSPRNAFVEWIERKGGRAYVVRANNKRVYYAVRVQTDGERTIQPNSDGNWGRDFRAMTYAPA